ncbi:MAG: hypothetical protein OEU92_21165, partial [Alphaproteobacteria bacterium]|nr:hypothetical protein [Alphaproteobacteria bacterium]
TGMIFQMNAVGLPKIFQVRLGDEVGASAMTAGALVSVVYLISTPGSSSAAISPTVSTSAGCT